MSGVWLVSYIALWVAVVVLAVLVIILYRELGEMYLTSSESRSRDGLAIGAKAPAFSLVDQGGRTVSIPLRSPTMLVFGSPGCAPCVALIPHMVTFAKQRAGRIEVVFVSAGDEASNRRLAQEHKVEFPVLTQLDSSTAETYEVRATPFAFFLDTEGKVRSKGVVNRLTQLEAAIGAAYGLGRGLAVLLVLAEAVRIGFSTRFIPPLLQRAGAWRGVLGLLSILAGSTLIAQAWIA